MADPEFRRQIDDARQSLRESILAKLADAGHDAIGVLMDLMHSAEDDRTRLLAAKSVLDSLTKFQQDEKPKVDSKTDAGQSPSRQVVIYIPDNGRDRHDGLPEANTNIE
ncbi:hypothetical protein [Rosistilla ulvae]|uniref:hypothetical protein n=1 Tax=Rosistilla ulvae TaxID=1930277 RepID=UPI00119FAAA9|nr:hypothetical protein [Rosistilla ulvae]